MVSPGRILSIAIVALLIQAVVARADAGPVPLPADLPTVLGLGVEARRAGLPAGQSLSGRITDAAKATLLGLPVGVSAELRSLGHDRYELRARGPRGPWFLRVAIGDFTSVGLYEEVGSWRSLPGGSRRLLLQAAVLDPARLEAAGFPGRRIGERLDLRTSLHLTDLIEEFLSQMPGSRNTGVSLSRLSSRDPARPGSLLVVRYYADLEPRYELGFIPGIYGLAPLPDPATWTTGARLTARVADSGKLDALGLKGLEAGRPVEIDCLGEGRIRITSLTPGFPLAIRIEARRPLELGLEDLALVDLGVGLKMKVVVANQKQARTAGLRWVLEGEPVEIEVLDRATRRLTGLAPERPWTVTDLDDVKIDPHSR